MLYYTHMKNINKNLILSGLILLTILAVSGVFMPARASAQCYTNCDNVGAMGYPTPVRIIPVYKPVYQTQPVVYQTQPVYQPQQVVYQTQPVYQNYPSYSNSTQANTSAYSNNQNTSENTDINTTEPKVTTNDYKSVTANAFYGKISFMPSGLVQWILLAIFILLIIIIVRRVLAKDEIYYSEPLKHA
jgi:hypothetical protein